MRIVHPLKRRRLRRWIFYPTLGIEEVCRQFLAPPWPKKYGLGQFVHGYPYFLHMAMAMFINPYHVVNTITCKHKGLILILHGHMYDYISP